MSMYDVAVLSSPSATIAQCQGVSVQTIPVASDLKVVPDVSRPVWACDAVRVGSHAVLTSCYKGYFTPVIGLHGCMDVFICPTIHLRQCHLLGTQNIVSLHGCGFVSVDATRLLVACQTNTISPTRPVVGTLPVSVKPYQAITACTKTQTDKAVPVPCSYYPVNDSIPPKDDSPKDDGNPNNPKTSDPTTSYIMHHNIHAHINGKIINPISFSIRTDISSFCWSGNLEIPHNDYIKHQSLFSEQSLITIQIDDYTFCILAEDITHNRAFIANSVSIGGRSITAHLSRDYAIAKPLSDTDLFASQIISEQLVDSTIECDYHLMDWRIAQGVYYTNNKTPIGVINEIATAGGGFVCSHHHLPKIFVRPKYRVASWELSAATPDRVIALSAIHKMTTQKQVNPRYNTITLVGQTGGIVYRVSEGGDKDAGVLEHILYTDDIMTTAGIAELSKSGIHSFIGITLRLSAKHGLDLANLGDIWQVNDERDGRIVPFRAIVNSVTVEVRVENGVPQIFQHVGLDRYDDV